MPIRREGEHADHATDPVVGSSTTEEGAMTAVMLDHEQADEKAGRGH
jgi:hypothetical protein